MSEVKKRLLAAATMTVREQMETMFRFLRQDELVVCCAVPGEKRAWFLTERADLERAILTRDHKENYQALYVHHNRVSPEAMARVQTYWVAEKSGVNSIEDVDIISLTTLPIDVDPKRAEPFGGKDNATADEAGLAVRVAVQIQELVAKSVGHHDSSALLFSGNGCWCHVALDNLDPATYTPVVRKTLEALARMYNAKGAEIDVRVADPRRISPLAGTFKRKKVHPGRPSRPTWIAAPQQVRPLSGPELERLCAAIVSVAPPPEPRPYTVRVPSIYDGPKDDSARNGADAVPVDQIFHALGQVDAGGNPVCPACNWANAGTVVYSRKYNAVHCYWGSCPGPIHWAPIDTVMHHVFGANRDDKSAFLKALNWIAERFGTKALEKRTFEVSSEPGMCVEGAEDEDDTEVNEPKRLQPSGSFTTKKPTF